MKWVCSMSIVDLVEGKLEVGKVVSVGKSMEKYKLVVDRKPFTGGLSVSFFQLVKHIDVDTTQSGEFLASLEKSLENTKC